MSREKTEEEVRKEFFNYLKVLIDHWSNVPNETDREKIEGYTHSLLAMIDGCAVDMCGFVLSPVVHESDKDFCIKNNKNYYPENDISDIKCDIAGNLHVQFYLNSLNK